MSDGYMMFKEVLPLVALKAVLYVFAVVEAEEMFDLNEEYFIGE